MTPEIQTKNKNKKIKVKVKDEPLSEKGFSTKKIKMYKERKESVDFYKMNKKIKEMRNFEKIKDKNINLEIKYDPQLENVGTDNLVH